MSLSAGSAPIRLVGVSAQGNTVFIEATEPVAYVVQPAGPVDRRSSNSATCPSRMPRTCSNAAIRSQRWRSSRGRRSTARRSRGCGSRSPGPPNTPCAARGTRFGSSSRRQRGRRQPARDQERSTGAGDSRSRSGGDRTTPRRRRCSTVFAPAARASATTVTLSGNGRLTPADVTEAGDRAAPARARFSERRVEGASPDDRRRPAGEARPRGAEQPRAARDPRRDGGRAGRDLSRRARGHRRRRSRGRVRTAAVREHGHADRSRTEPPRGDVEPDIPLQQAIANAASITPTETPAGSDVGAEAARRAGRGAARRLPSRRRGPRRHQRRRASRRLHAAVAPPQQPPATPPAPSPPPPSGSAGHLRRDRQEVHRAPDQARFLGRRPARGAAALPRDQRAEHRHRSRRSGHAVDVVLRDVPWDQALDIILRAHKLGYAVDGTIVRIAPIAVLAEEEGERRKLAEAKALAGELRVLTFSLSYAKADDMSAAAGEDGALGARQIQVDARTNTLIITDLPDRLQTATALIDDARSAAAAGRNRSAHRADHTRLRAGARRPVGLQRPRRPRRSATPPASRSRTAAARRPDRRDAARRAIRARPADDTTATAVNLGVAGRDVGDRPGARLGQRRVQPRRRAVGARAHAARAASSRRRA